MGKELTEFINKYFDISVEITPLDITMPWAAKHWFDSSLLKIGGFEFLCLSLKPDAVPIQEIQFSLRKIREAEFSWPTVIHSKVHYPLLEKIALVNKIGLIVPDSYCYLPQFLLFAGRKLSPVKNNKKLGILATLLCVFYLEGLLPRLFKTGDVKIDASKAAISRALAELEAKGIVTINRKNKTYHIMFKPLRVALWGKRNVLFSAIYSAPVSIARHSMSDLSLRGNLSALSYYSNLSSPETPFYIIDIDKDIRKGFPMSESTINTAALAHLKRKGVKVIEDGELYHGNVNIQIQPYQIQYFDKSDSNITTPVFTYLGVEPGDPRTYIALSQLEELINKNLFSLDEADSA
ncbi:hypothetical protein ACO1PK_01025 [Alishewanella sp. d11]|uniref:hypothetical protein n=1 Tax=Alishewanella sp. d11 TaxID=3414030 RepID=UPI003BF90B2A